MRARNYPSSLPSAASSGAGHEFDKTTRRSEQDPSEIELLLPWYAAGTLEPARGRRSKRRSPTIRSSPAASNGCARNSRKRSISMRKRPRRRPATTSRRCSPRSTLCRRGGRARPQVSSATASPSFCRACRRARWPGRPPRQPRHRAAGGRDRRHHVQGRVRWRL